MDGTAMTMSNFYEYLYGRVMTADDAPQGLRKHPDGSPCSAKSDETCPILRHEKRIDKSDVLDPLLEEENKETEGSKMAESPEERARREYAEVVARYTNADGSKKRGWLKAPNGKDTNLDERQWVQVRTPSFKRWFGDWEKLATSNAILEEADIVSHEKLLNMPPEEQRIEARRIFDSLVNSLGPDEKITTTDGRPVRLSYVGFREIKQHSADPHTLALVPILPEAISSAHYIGDGDPKVKDGRRMDYHLYARRVNVGDGSMIARIVLREDVNGNIFYDEELTSLEYIKAIKDSVAREPNASGNPRSPYAAHSIAQFFAECKGLSASKVVDENGEPKVVYRGVLGSEPIPRSSMEAGLGIFTSSSEDVASDYTFPREYGELVTEQYNDEPGDYEPIEPGELYHCFANIRKPVVTDDDTRLVHDTSLQQRHLEKAKAEGHDGVIMRNVPEGIGRSETDRSDNIIVFSPNQIKSATDNTGAFSQGDDDIGR